MSKEISIGHLFYYFHHNCFSGWMEGWIEMKTVSAGNEVFEEPERPLCFCVSCNDDRCFRHSVSCRYHAID